MPSYLRHKPHDRYRSRIAGLLESYAGSDSTPESQSHNAKYLAVLVSGYLEQAIKEILLQYSSNGSRPAISRYIEETWPVSMNMNVDNIDKLLHRFSSSWAEQFHSWLGEDENRKADINSIVAWRNGIAHGQESNTNGVTLVSVKSKFCTIKELVVFIEGVIV